MLAMMREPFSLVYYCDRIHIYSPETYVRVGLGPNTCHNKNPYRLRLKLLKLRYKAQIGPYGMQAKS